MPARAIEWSTALVEGLFYSVVNFALCFPLLVGITFRNFPLEPPIGFAFGILVILLVGPIVWPLLLVKAMRSERLMKNLQMPYPTAWDAFFDRRLPCFLLIHLKDGGMIGGYFGPGSYASGFPREGDLYLAAVYHLDEGGRFSKPVPDTRGVLLRKDDYAYIEVFDLPTETESDHEKQRASNTEQGESGDLPYQ